MSLADINRLNAEARAVHEYRKTEPCRHMLALLDSLRAEYLERLVSVRPEQLGELQGAVRQVDALRGLLSNDTFLGSPAV